MKIHRAHRSCHTALLACTLLFVYAAQTQANLVYTLTLNVASLVGNPNGPFSLDVTLSSGSQTPNSDNTVTLSSFAFVNGSVGSTSYSSGGQTGSMSSSVTLTNSGLDNELAQTFSSTVTEIRFSVNMTSNTNNPFQDQFYVSILDGGLNNIPTTDPSGGNTLALVNINTGQTINSVNTYQSTANSATPGVNAAVPEPATSAALLIGGIVGFGLYNHRKTFRRPAGA